MNIIWDETYHTCRKGKVKIELECHETDLVLSKQILSLTILYPPILLPSSHCPALSLESWFRKE